MDNISVIKFLKSFSKKEIEDFDKFIRSEYINCPGSVLKFYNEIRKHYPFINNNLPAIEKLFNILYPERKFKDNTIRKLASDLKKIIDRFIYDKLFYENSILIPRQHDAGFFI